MRHLSQDHGPEGAPVAPGRQWAALAEFVPYMWPRGRADLRMRIAIAIAALVVSKVVGVLTPIPLARAVDALEGNQAVGLVLMLVAAYAIGRILTIGVAQLRDYVSAPVGQHAMREVARETFAHLHRLSLRFHLERRTGGVARVIERGIDAIDFLVRFSLFNVGPTLLELVLLSALFWAMFGIVFPIVMIVTVAAYVAFTFVVTEWRTKIMRVMYERDADSSTKAVDSLLNYETVKYFGNEAHETRRFDEARAAYETAAVRTSETLAFLNAGQATIFNLGLGALLVLAAMRVQAGTMTVGQFGAINVWLMQLYQPLNLLGMVYREIKAALVNMEAMFNLLDLNPEIQDRPNATALAVDGAEIRFESVNFHYDPARPILRNVSFTVPAGHKVAIVGPSGAGKSTISRILFRFYEIAGGRVLIDGQDVRDVTQTSLRAAIGMVPQDTVLFNDTIAYNIRYGRPDASEEDVIAAARIAQIDDFVKTLPDGYKTMVGERGLKLSGGEKQRVAIARTVLKNPSILLLDEATSALDSHTEKEIVSALNAVSANRTTLVVAHRLSTIIDADEILVLEKGEIVERGRHASLLALNGAYAAMWRRQQEAAQVREQLDRVLGSESDKGGHAAPPELVEP